MNVSPEKLIAAAAENGWDFFRDMLTGPAGRQSAVTSEQIAEAERLAHAWATFYATDDGRKCIEHLISLTLERPVWTAQLGLPMEQAYGHGCLREGQNAIVATILRMIAEGRKQNREDIAREDQHADDGASQRAAVAIATGNERRGKRRRASR